MSGNPRFDGTASDERFFFNGQPLVRLCPGPDCPSGQIETPPSWANGWRYYRLQNDTMHARFYLSADGRQWRVQLKNTGTRLELGSPDKSDEGIEYMKYERCRSLKYERKAASV
jgi:hypothetical protein